MLLSIGLIFILGFLLSGIFARLRVPSLIGIILSGVILGPFALDMISKDILNISSELRKIALAVILIRAGLSLNIDDLKKVGKPAMLMSFIPATFEIIIVTILSPILLGLSYLEGAILGSVLAAASPAIIVPRMIHLIDTGYGKNKKIPEIIMSGASVDDIYVIVLFTTFLGMYKGTGFSAITLISIPLSIILGLVLGILGGAILNKIFKILSPQNIIKVLVTLSTAFIFISLEDILKPYVPISGMLSVMALGGTILKLNKTLAIEIKGNFSSIWIGAEILLFTLVGASVNIHSLSNIGIGLVALIVISLIFRTIGVNLSLYKTNLNLKEKLFCSIAYIPKATVQAAIGGIPLAEGVKSGNIILTIAVLSILITAPIGAIGIDNTYRKLLDYEKKS